MGQSSNWLLLYAQMLSSTGALDGQSGVCTCGRSAVVDGMSTKKITRAGLAGKVLGKALAEVAHLLYQVDTRNNFMEGLME